MKLISMTDFVLEQDITLSDSKFKIVNYANFLKQPLKLEMFVPCDENGNILEEPVWQVEFEKNKVSDSNLIEKSKQYEQAEDKVLFEGCSTMQQGENTIVIFNDSAIWLTWTNRIVEDLLKDRVILTPNAIKQFM